MEEPTEWVSHLVIVKKSNGKLRLCLDPHNLNQAIQRPHYQMPIIEEIIPKLSKAKIFSVLDAKDGFWQIPLSNESSMLTCFNTPFGRYRWNVLPFGVNCAPEEFQRRMHQALEGLPGTAVIADDILVYGEGENVEEAQKDHEINLRKLLERCKEKNIKINQDKMKLRLEEVRYMGHIISKDGVKIDPKKVEAITQMPRPKDLTQLKRFMGMTTYLTKFLPNLATEAEPLRKLDQKDNAWCWNN